MKIIVTLSVLLIPLICLIGSVDGAIIIDHTCADLDQIPASWIEAVQDNIPSHYAHTSHGSQLTWGLQFIKAADPFYDFEIGDKYLPSVSGAWCIFNGQESYTYIGPELYWQTETGMNLTRDVLDHNPTIVTSMWCWCCQCNSYNEAEVQAYLDSMTVLELEYPGVTFSFTSPAMHRAQEVAATTDGRGMNRSEITASATIRFSSILPILTAGGTILEPPHGNSILIPMGVMKSRHNILNSMVKSTDIQRLKAAFRKVKLSGG